jgi:hypothetical protein
MGGTQLLERQRSGGLRFEANWAKSEIPHLSQQTRCGGGAFLQSQAEVGPRQKQETLFQKITKTTKRPGTLLKE